MNKTRSILFESIQHSPIDPIMMDETSGGLVTPEDEALIAEIRLRLPSIAAFDPEVARDLDDMLVLAERILRQTKIKFEACYYDA